MSRLTDLFTAVKEQNLNKEQLEDLFSQMSRLRADVKMELGAVKKEKAMFMLRSPEKSVAQRKIEWQGSDRGQRELELESYKTAMGDHLDSLKTRIYSLLT